MGDELKMDHDEAKLYTDHDYEAKLKEVWYRAQIVDDAVTFDENGEPVINDVRKVMELPIEFLLDVHALVEAVNKL